MSCIICTADPVGERTSEGHVAVRLGDRDIKVLLYGKEVLHAFEAIGGQEGSVYFYPDPISTCSVNPDHAHAEVAHGFVQVMSDPNYGTVYVKYALR